MSHVSYRSFMSLIDESLKTLPLLPCGADTPTNTGVGINQERYTKIHDTQIHVDTWHVTNNTHILAKHRHYTETDRDRHKDRDRYRHRHTQRHTHLPESAAN